MHSFRQIQEATRTENHGGELLWPGSVDGFPARIPPGTRPPDLRGDEGLNLNTAIDFNCQLFRMWEAADVEKFKQVMQRVKCGWYVQTNRMDRWDETEQRGPVVWLEWLQVYVEPSAQSLSGQMFVINRSASSL